MVVVRVVMCVVVVIFLLNLGSHLCWFTCRRCTYSRVSDLEVTGSTVRDWVSSGPRILIRVWPLSVDLDHWACRCQPTRLLYSVCLVMVSRKIVEWVDCKGWVGIMKVHTWFHLCSTWEIWCYICCKIIYIGDE